MSAEIDLDQRFLCADGACIGVIGANGRCSVCAAPLSPHDVADFERATGVDLGPDVERAIVTTPDTTGTSVSPTTVLDLDDEAPDLENRELCADGTCVGVIGPDGACKVCGKQKDDGNSAAVGAAE